MTSLETKIVIPEPKNTFKKIKCSSCSNMQVMYTAPQLSIKCLACETILATPGASKAIMKTTHKKTKKGTSHEQ